MEELLKNILAELKTGKQSKLLLNQTEAMKRLGVKEDRFKEMCKTLRIFPIQPETYGMTQGLLYPREVIDSIPMQLYEMEQNKSGVSFGVSLAHSYPSVQGLFNGKYDVSSEFEGVLEV